MTSLVLRGNLANGRVQICPEWLVCQPTQSMKAVLCLLGQRDPPLGFLAPPRRRIFRHFEAGYEYHRYSWIIKELG